jgi:hypothetical protein
MSTDEADGGKAPSQWFVRLASIALLATVAVQLLRSIDDLKRYWRIKQM